MLVKIKLNIIETLISEALKDLEVSHEKLKTNVHEKEQYEKRKDDIKMIKSSDELGKNNKNVRKNRGNAQN